MFALLFAVILFGAFLVSEIVKTGETVAFSAAKASKMANSHQPELALEVFYSEKGFYPDVQGGMELLEILHSEGYINKIPASVSDFGYYSTENGTSYSKGKTFGEMLK